MGRPDESKTPSNDDRKIAELRVLIEEGIESGDAGPLDIEEVIAEARRGRRTASKPSS